MCIYWDFDPGMIVRSSRGAQLSHSNGTEWKEGEGLQKDVLGALCSLEKINVFVSQLSRKVWAERKSRCYNKNAAAILYRPMPPIQRHAPLLFVGAQVLWHSSAHPTVGLWAAHGFQKNVERSLLAHKTKASG